MRKKLFTYFRRALACFMLLIVCLPLPNYEAPTATAVFSTQGNLLAARIASDEQWRFEEERSVPQKFETCLLTFEDKHFYYHPGINPIALFRAVKLNVSSGSIRSGASTITMQTIRMGRKHPPRTLIEKGYEMLLSLHLEIHYSKKKILRLYCSHAPFGNNVVGLSAASWRYYQKSPEQLTWAESATLAVLPNAPSLIYPGKRNPLLWKKRNQLLYTLWKRHAISDDEYHHACLESLPQRPSPLPLGNACLLQYVINTGNEGKRVQTTLNDVIQQRIRKASETHLKLFGDDDLRAAVLVTDVNTGSILAYQGNLSTGLTSYVDCIQAHRSSGSVLKPFLFAQAIDQGLITPNTMLPDIPVAFGNYMPSNYAKHFEGWVSAKEALARSMNVPMILLLKEVGIQNFKTRLRQCGFKAIELNKKDYGLPLIVGGADVSLFEVCNAYTVMASSLKTRTPVNIHLIEHTIKPTIPFSEAAIYESLQAIRGMKRPDENGNWQYFDNPQQIAWKTGTSFGNRDAWAVGVSEQYVVAVWIGHEQAISDQNLVGFKAAAPLMFSIMNQLRGNHTWYRQPLGSYETITLCKESGRPAGENCPHVQSIKVPRTCITTLACSYHQCIWLTSDSSRRVRRDCYPDNSIVRKAALILPPLMEKYTLAAGKLQEIIPPWFQDCISNQGELQIQYPQPNTTIHLNADGLLPMEIAGAGKQTIFWQLDDQFLEETQGEEQLTITPSPGEHTLLVNDRNGRRASCTFNIE